MFCPLPDEKEFVQDGILPTVLLSRKEEVDATNKAQLQKLSGETVIVPVVNASDIHVQQADVALCDQGSLRATTPCVWFVSKLLPKSLRVWCPQITLRAVDQGNVDYLNVRHSV